MTETETQKHFHDFLSANNILCNVKCADRDELLRLLLSTLKRHHPGLDLDLAAREVKEREELFPTVIAPGLAVPHARIPDLSAPLVAMACSPEGVDFASEMGPVKVTILLLTPVDEPNLHMQLLAALAGDFGGEGVVDRVAAMKTPAEVIGCFSGSEHTMPTYLKAADVMRGNVVTVYENDTLQTAIRTFATSGIDELVVIDRTGDLRGVVSLTDLLKFSLPEHLLWMEDLTPIYRFQPFADMLKSSDDTRVADIMREEFVTVDREVPAVQLAKLFLVHQVHKLIITGPGGKLAGVVELKEFCAKLFWE